MTALIFLLGAAAGILFYNFIYVPVSEAIKIERDIRDRYKKWPRA